jgi:16S rRNA (uracil1498-N3)-methyltransferase
VSYNEMTLTGTVKKMHRIYFDSVEGDTIAVADAGQLHHLKDVLRLKVNDSVVVFDGQGREFDGVISAIERKQTIIKVTSSKPVRPGQIELTIACAVPKSDHMDDLVDQLTQLGVRRIIPMMTERVVVRLDEVKKEARLKRWQKIARNAALQSQRNTLPVIDPVTFFGGVIALSQGYDLKLIPHLEGEKKLIRNVLAGAGPEKILVLIGPEGDFTPDEVKLALEAGFIPVSLGDTVLRVATAAVAVASFLKFTLGE